MFMLTKTPQNQRLVALLQGVAGRDHAAFRQLYDLTCAHLYGVAMRFVGRRELADEVLQEAFINVWHHAGSYAASLSTPMTWLISIVRNKSLDHLRKARLETANTVALDDSFMAEAAEEAGADQLELLTIAMDNEELRRRLARLEPAQRQSLSLAYYQGLSHSEIAHHMRVPLGTVKAWIRRALQQLRLSYAAWPGCRAGMPAPVTLARPGGHGEGTR